MRFFRSRRVLPLSICIGLLLAVFLSRRGDGALEATSPPATEDPRLVVYVVVDQLRGDLIERYADVFTGGFARLMEEGYRFTNATFDHSMTATAPGHATASTGTHPHRHGLVGNEWRERNPDGTWSTVYALRQLSAPILGMPAMENLASTLSALAGIPFPDDLDGRVVIPEPR